MALSAVIYLTSIECFQCILAQLNRLIEILRHIFYFNIVIINILALNCIRLVLSGKVLESLRVDRSTYHSLALPLLIKIHASQPIQLLLDVHKLDFRSKF